MPSSLADQVNVAFHHAALAADADLRLAAADSDEARNALVRLASDHYTKAVEMLLMEIRPRYAGDARALEVLSQGTSFLMDRLAAIEPVPDHPRRKSSAAAPPVLDDDQTAKERLNVVREILETEKRYVKALEDMNLHYVVPLKLGEILNDDEYTLAFSALPAIINLGKQMISMLEKQTSSWNPSSTCVGEVFIRLAPFLKMYTPYTNNFKAAQDMLATKDMEDLEEQARLKQVPLLRDLAIMPIQRIPRYVLLLTELKKKTPFTHPDAKLIREALDKVALVANAVNEQMRASELDAKILQIQNSLWSATGSIPDLVAPRRKFIKQGPVAKIRQNGTLKKNYYLFCFNDIVVYATKSPILRNRFHFHKTIEFFGAFAADQEAQALGTDLKYGQAVFKITGSNGYRLFVVESDAQRREWLSALTLQVEENESRRKSWSRLQGQADVDDGEEEEEEEEEEDSD